MADRLRVTELDFDTIKTNLKAFLQQQNQFTDYDFEGSGLNILLDILAYNTHYNAYYLNMVANESFLDTALLRDSVVSHAKSFGYTPYSKRASIATINFTANSSSSTSSTLTIPSGFSFLSNQIDGKSYNFVVLNATTVTKANSEFVFENLNIYEGQLITYNFNHNESSNPKQIFILPDENIDTTTLKVTVTPSSSNTATTTYTKATEILDVGPSSEVFFLQENRNGKFEVYFGNDIVGKKLADGSIVSATYLVTNGKDSDKANNFIATTGLTDSLSESLTTFTITPVSAASGGADRETVDEIKYSAPLQYVTQNRLVTKKDYESYVRRNYPSLDSLSVWGGEDEDPPVYGKVFLSLKPKTNFYISETEKQRIIDDIIKPKSMLSVATEIRDPEYVYILLNNYIKYDPKKTTYSESVFKTQIRNAILSYKETYLDKFNGVFAVSKMQDTIDNVDLNAITGNEVLVRVQKRFTPTLGSRTNYEINFNIPLHRGTLNDKLSSTEFRSYDATNTLRTTFIEEVPQSYSGISEINIVNAGYGYTSAPTVTISGDGTGATATAVVTQGKITAINITNRGFDYTRATISITGGGGFSGSATITVDSSTGTLRTIYFDANAQRQVINPSIGSINYNTGVITISDLNIVSVATTDGLVRLTIGSDDGVIESYKNTIITIDETDPAAITTTLQSVLV